jgi:hypothetical protein
MERIKLFADGHTEPAVPDRSVVILIQDGQVSLGKLLLQNYVHAPGEIEHPRNETGLALEARKLIKDTIPLVLVEQQSVLLLCPESLASKMLW